MPEIPVRLFGGEPPRLSMEPRQYPVMAAHLVSTIELIAQSRQVEEKQE